VVEASFSDVLRKRLAVARGDEPADLVLSGGKVFSVFTGEFLDADVAVSGEHVVGIGRYEGRETADVSGLFLIPGLIDAHMHIESTKLMVDEFARAVLPRGTTTVVLDAHEIANVFGLRGVSALLEAASSLPLDYYVMASPCVPASPFESGGAIVDAEDIARFLAEEPRAIGIAEMMNFLGVVRGDADMVAKIEAAHRAGTHIDGHAPGVTGAELNAYLAAGPHSDHECTTYEEALEKRRLGMWIMLREGSATKDVQALIPLVQRFGPRNCMLVTDDREPNHIVRDGHMNDVLRRAVALGCSPEDAIVMGTLHPARWHRLHEHGAIAPGYLADILALEDLERFEPAKVWKRGRLVAENGRASEVVRVTAPDWMRGSVHVNVVSAADLEVRAAGPVRVIKVLPSELVTRSEVADLADTPGVVEADPGRDIAKVTVVERHKGTGRMGFGFVSGFGLRSGAIASTIAHDAHNLVVIGVNDSDMATAVNRSVEIGGGQVAVADGLVLAEVSCPIGGLLSDRPFEEVAAAVDAMEEAAGGLGVDLPHPFMAMSLLALSVLPELRITDRGLVDVDRFELVPLEA